MPIAAEAVTGAINGVMQSVEGLVTNAEERGKVLAELGKVKTSVVNDVLNLERETISGRLRVIEAEAKSEHKITAIWRPVMMLSFGAIVVYNMAIAPIFGLTPVNAETTSLPTELWAVIKLGLGGYVVGRSGEKIAKTVMTNVRDARLIDPLEVMKPKKRMKMRKKLIEAGLDPDEVMGVG
jgi:hypothetical protein